MNIHAPQAIYLILVFIGLGYDAANHGKETGARHNVVVTLIANSLLTALLYWGGFFN